MSYTFFQIKPLVIDGQAVSLATPRSGPIANVFGMICAHKMLMSPNAMITIAEEFKGRCIEENGQIDWLLVAHNLSQSCAKKYLEGKDLDSILEISQEYAEENSDAWLRFWINEIKSRNKTAPRYRSIFGENVIRHQGNRHASEYGRRQGDVGPGA